MEELEKNASEILRRLGEEDILAYQESLKTMLATLKKLDEAA
jgi:hypothetical protein